VPRPGWREGLLAAGALAVLALTLLLLELSLRRADPAYLSRLRDNAVDRLHVYSEAYGWAPRPGAEAIEHGARTRINALGQRGRPIPRVRSSRRRVLLLGDSTAFGYGVGDDDTYAARLDATPGAPEVVNLGVEGFGPDQALLRYEREGVAYAPDVVIFSLCVDNDFADARLPVFLYDGRHPKPYFTLQAGQLVLHDTHLRLNILTRLAVRLAERSHLYNRLVRRGRTPLAGDGEGWRARRERVLADRNAAVDLVAQLLRRWNAGAQARGAHLLVLLHPSKVSMQRGCVLVDALRTRLQADGIATLDLAASYRAQGLRFADVAFDPTGHLSPAGHARLATLLQAHPLLLDQAGHVAGDGTGTAPRARDVGVQAP
jgi:hypothetical protein